MKNVAKDVTAVFESGTALGSFEKLSVAITMYWVLAISIGYSLGISTVTSSSCLVAGTIATWAVASSLVEYWHTARCLDGSIDVRLQDMKAKDKCKAQFACL